MTLRTVFHLALRQTKGLIGSLLQLLGLDLAAPDHSTLSRRAETLDVPRPRGEQGPVHLLVDSTGLKLFGPGEWLVEKHGTAPSTCRPRCEEAAVQKPSIESTALMSASISSSGRTSTPGTTSMLRARFNV